ncbi:MAG TPA: hypothetical protein PK743_02055 [Luteimonas sp.]|nr:hypothetical protein [Luteimonas sp.]
MSQREHTPLTPEERELAQTLSRLDAQAAPSSELDARILAAAQAAVESPAAATARAPRRTRRRWPVGLGVAASLLVAVGIAWQLRPLPDTQVLPTPTESVTLPYETAAEVAPAAVELLRTAPSATSRDEAAVAAPALASTPTPAPEEPEPQVRDERKRQQAAEFAAAEAARQQAGAREAEEQAVAAQRADVPATVAAPSTRDGLERTVADQPPLSPPPPPAPAPAPLAAEPAFVPPPPAAAVPETVGKATREERRALAAPAAAPASTPPSTDAASGRMLSADAVGGRTERSITLDSRVEPPPIEIDAFADQPLDDQPPASADSPEVREHWLQRIRELRDAGELEAARDSLREFVRRHPQAEVPADLHPLLAGG